jgi:hypothetical protein
VVEVDRRRRRFLSGHEAWRASAGPDACTRGAWRSADLVARYGLAFPRVGRGAPLELLQALDESGVRAAPVADGQTQPSREKDDQQDEELVARVGRHAWDDPTPPAA